MTVPDIFNNYVQAYLLNIYDCLKPATFAVSDQFVRLSHQVSDGRLNWPALKSMHSFAENLTENARNHTDKRAAQTAYKLIRLLDDVARHEVKTNCTIIEQPLREAAAKNSIQKQPHALLLDALKDVQWSIPYGKDPVEFKRAVRYLHDLTVQQYSGPNGRIFRQTAEYITTLARILTE